MTILGRRAATLLLIFGSISQITQAAFNTTNLTSNPVQNVLSLDQRLYTPIESLNFLSKAEFTVLRHPLFPKHSARIKKTDFCDPTVNGYSGYIDIEARHLFFYFFESRSSPETDDVIFWTNGGPGCSSSIGLFMELGPCRILDEHGPKSHPESWNSNANIFFIDQPVGVGFSYAEYGETVGTTEEAAKDIAAFVAIFFENFSQFRGRPLHMAGESYGGRYVPLFASAVYDQNSALINAGLAPINLTSIMIGNGTPHLFHKLLAFYDMSCTTASLPPVLDISTCVAMKQLVPRCRKWMKESCIDQFDAINCNAAVKFCEESFTSPFWKTGKNPYNLNQLCEGGLEVLCYPATKHISNFLSDPDIKAKLGVDMHPSIPSNFTGCSSYVGDAFERTLDRMHLSTLHIGALLERGIRVLIYVGTYDWMSSWVASERWTLELDWSGRDEFVGQELKEWYVDGKRAGRVRKWGNFAFVTVDGAGHMVPYDKPKQALEMVNRWLAGKGL
ncbi:hypothetical protein VNI00_011427 [Paramarasmius palmivorus]|uniref:Carboxypeptidase n=1 Tax=Paramarasmius palmivorus TaxID=297713 RepID=A0AAW0CCD7_9AGAR